MRKLTIVITGICSITILLSFLATILLLKLRREESSNYYRAAVLEAVPFSDRSISVLENVKKNLETYQMAANLAKKNDVDIIVFPESVLLVHSKGFMNNRSELVGSVATDIPNPKDGDYNPCEQENMFKNHYLLRNLSCMAKSNNLYVVANVIDYKMCKNGGGTKDMNATLNCSNKSQCPSDGFYLYNANIVFNRAGKLIARYHKKHMFLEPEVDPSKCSDNGYFDTEFGNFTTFVCMDMFYKEGREAVEQLNVDNLAYPNFWYDHEIAFFFSNAYHQSYAYSNRINVLSANGHVPGLGTVGSGIYSGKNGALISTHQPDGYTKLLISNVPKQPKTFSVKMEDLERKRFKLANGTFTVVQIEDDIILEDYCEEKEIGPPKDEFKDYRCNPLNFTDYKFERLIGPEGKVDLCINAFCCSLTYEARSMNETYFLGVQAGYFDAYELIQYSNQICFIARCRSESGEDCSNLYMKSETVFDKVEITGTFTNKYIIPFSLDANIRLTSKDKWDYDGDVRMSYGNNIDNSSLLMFGLYAREYS